MLQRMNPTPLHLSAYDDLVRPELLAQVRALAAPLRGLRVVHVNATPDGGGVAEILRSLVPLSRDLGLDASWSVLPPDDAFFAVTKRLHNLLQGRAGQLSARQRRTYWAYLERLAPEMGDMQADVWVIHDPQPLALKSLVPLGGARIWVCHIDCSAPNPAVRDYVLPWIRDYDRVFFSMPDYVLPGLVPERVRIARPAIDPLTAKNRPLPSAEARAVLAGLGLDPARPLVAQVSRFDPWKNPWQAVDAYRLAKRQVPELQLALVGVFSAKDDPEGPKVYRAIRGYAGRDPDVHLFTDPERVGPLEVNAFQAASSVVLQRSTREGFGLTVTEAMWKERPVIATPVGGITAQIEHGRTGFLDASTEACADRIVQLVREPGLAATIGRAARDSVRERFLLPRLLRDHLVSYGELVCSGAAPAAA